MVETLISPGICAVDSYAALIFCEVFDSRVRAFVRVCIRLPETMRNLFVRRVEFDHLKPDAGVAAFVAYDLVSPQEMHII